MLSEENFKSALKLYQQVVTPELVKATLESLDIVTERRGGIFSTAVVVWLMIFQRLSEDHTLSAAIEHLKVSDIRELLLTSEAKSIKARNGRISSNTGGYSQGRQRVPLVVVEQLTDVLNGELSDVAYQNKKQPQEDRIYAIDGATLIMSCSEENIDEYSQHKTRFGTAHYPLTQLTVAIDMISGVATRPVMGAHNGSKATSEIAQSHEVLSKLEKGSIVLADRLYGVTQVVHKTHQLGLQFIVRVKDAIASRFVKTNKKKGDVEVLWRPSKYEQKRYPYLTDVEIPGRFIWKTIQQAGFKPIKLVLFTTCDKSVDEIVKLYGLRWNIEQDIRNLKTTLELNFINAQSPDMVKKEIITGVTAYNLVRHFMKVVAKQLQTPIRSLSFKATLRRLTTFGFAILSQSSDANSKARFDRSMKIALTDLNILKLPSRKNSRPTQPRKKWRRGGTERYRSSKTF
jgi:hypothetical protein